MEVTYLGHATFLIQINEHKILFDPFISPNELAEHIDLNTIQADYILLSHGHKDHVADVEAIYKNSETPMIVSNFEIVKWFQNKGLDNGHGMNHGGKWVFDFGVVKMVNAVHSSSMPDGSYGGNPAGFVINTPEKTFYYAGDTALHQDMKQIGEEFNIDVAFLPIGDNFTMGIHDAMKAANYVGASKVIAMHFDTFPAITIDHQEVKDVAEQYRKELLLMDIGQSTHL